MLHYDHPLPVIIVSCDSHSHLSLVVSIGFNNKLVLSSTSCMSTIMMCHFIIIFNTAGSIEVYQEESHNHMYTNMATKDESELVPLSSKGAVKALKDHEDKLVTSLKDTDLVSLARFGSEGGFISQDVKESLESMDPNVHWPTKIRYLFLHVYESLQSNPRLYERWLKLLSEHSASSEALEQVRLSYEGYCARESDHSVSAMTESLTDGISEELSGNGSAAGTKRPHNYAPLEELVSKRPCLEVAHLEIISQTHDLKVSDQKSALLEVHVTTSHDITITYQWIKDGVPLSDDSTYCGTHKQILCINDVTMASEGTYHCEVQTHENKKLQSEPIKLIVKVSPEKKVLIDMYLSQPEVPKDTWPPVSNNTYINLALIKPGAIDKAGKYAYNTIQGDVDDILKDKDRIEYEEVFSNLVSGTLLLIEGRPGSGKTTLVHKFSQDWASGKLNLKNVRFLFLVHLRVLLNDPSIKLRDILKHYYEDQVRLDQILDHSERFSGEGLCFVLDGLDEYSPKGKKNTTIFKLINKQLLPKSIVVVASRPAAVVHLKSVATKRVEVLGFRRNKYLST